MEYRGAQNTHKKLVIVFVRVLSAESTVHPLLGWKNVYSQYLLHKHCQAYNKLNSAIT